MCPAFLVAALSTTEVRRQIEERRTGAAPMMQKITKPALMGLRIPMLREEHEQPSLPTAFWDARAAAQSLPERAEGIRAAAWAEFEDGLGARGRPGRRPTTSPLPTRLQG